MANNVLVLTLPGGATLIPPGVVTIEDASGFDTVTARYITQSTREALTNRAEFKPGGNATCPVTATKMILMGLSDLNELPGNVMEYTLTWRGLINAVAGRDAQITETRSVRERYFENLSGVAGVPNGSRVRLMEMQAGVSVRQIHTSKPEPPALSREADNTLHGISKPPAQYKVTGAPITYVFPSGWVCYSWQAEQPIPGIWFVSAEYKYEFPQQSG